MSWACLRSKLAALAIIKHPYISEEPHLSNSREPRNFVLHASIWIATSLLCKHSDMTEKAIRRESASRWDADERDQANSPAISTGEAQCPWQRHQRQHICRFQTRIHFLLVIAGAVCCSWWFLQSFLGNGISIDKPKIIMFAATQSSDDLCFLSKVGL